MAAQIESTIDSQRMLMAKVSHELRTPLHSLSMSLDLLKGLPGLPENAITLVDTANAASKLALALVGDMLDLSRVDFGTGPRTSENPRSRSCQYMAAHRPASL